MKLQRTIALMLSFTLSMPSHAGLKEAFDGIFGGTNVTATSPGRFQGSTRGGFTGGSVDIRFPTSGPVRLISIDPPKMPSAGCGGISAHFGGFSFVSGKQIEQMINNLAQGATGVAISLAMKTLCPMCENVISQMTALAQKASMQAADACKIGANMANLAAKEMFGAKVGQGGDNWKGFCVAKETREADKQDSLEAWVGDGCASANKALDTLGGWIKEAEGQKPGSGDAAAVQIRMGNITWKFLKTLDFGPDENVANGYRELLMSIMGTKVVVPRLDAKDVPREQAYPPTLVVGATSSKDTSGKIITDNLFKLMMCGGLPLVDASAAEGSAGQNRYAFVDAYCAETNGAAGKATTLRLYSCSGDYVDCENPIKVEAATHISFRSPGFYYTTVDTLFSAMDAVIRDDPAFYRGSAKGKQFMQLANSVPFPLYQAVNIAAVNPIGGMNLLQVLALPVAEILTTSYFEHVIQEIAQAAPKEGADEEMLQNMHATLSSARNSMDANLKGLLDQLALQAGILEQIRVANLTVQREVMTPELLNSGRYANLINNIKQQTTGGSAESNEGAP